MAGRTFIDLAITEVLPAALERVPEAIARREHILPLTFDGERLTVVASEPLSSETRERLRFALNCPVSAAMASHDAIGDAIEQYYGGDTAQPATLPPAPTEQVEFVEIPERPDASQRHMLDPDSPAVVRMVQKIIGEALHLAASRVLLLPLRDRLKVAYRIGDSVCTREDAPRNLHYPILVRLMAMTNLSGFIKVHVGEKEFPLRAVFKPSQFGLLALIEVGGKAAQTKRWEARVKRLGYPIVDLQSQHISGAILELLPESIARRQRCLPVALDGHVLTVVMSEPPAPEVLEQLQFVANRPVSVAMAPAGDLLAAIDRCYGSADAEAADVILWELAQATEAPAADAGSTPSRPSKPTPASRQFAKAVFDHLYTLYHDKMFALFEQIRSGAKLCRRDPKTGELAVVFPQSHLIEQLPPPARQYIEGRIWALREAVIVRLETFLAGNPAMRGAGMTYALYLLGCQLREGQRPSIDPADMRDAWLNFLYALAGKLFPTVQSNGALLSLVNGQLDQFAAKTIRLFEDPSLVRDPASSQPRLARLSSDTAAEESLAFDSPPVVHLVDLLLAEAVHARASRLVIVPQEDHVEVAYRVQTSVYTRPGLPQHLLSPMVARLCSLANSSGEFQVRGGPLRRDARVALSPVPSGLAAVVDLLSNRAAIKASQALAARHHLEFVELAHFDAPPDLLHAVPMAVLRSKMVLPLSRDERSLKVAVSSPPSPRQLDVLRLAFNSLIRPALSAEDDLRAALYRHGHLPAEPSGISAAALALLGGESA